MIAECELNVWKNISSPRGDLVTIARLYRAWLAVVSQAAMMTAESLLRLVFPTHIASKLHVIFAATDQRAAQLVRLCIVNGALISERALSYSPAPLDQMLVS